MKNLTAFLLIVFLTVSCSSKKQIVKTDTEVKTVTEVTSSQKQEAKADVNTVTSVAQDIAETDSVVVNETVVELSQPDSTGKQHPEKITTRVITSGKNRQAKTVTNTEQKQITSNTLDKTEGKVVKQDISTQVDIKTVVKKPVWIRAIIILAIVAALVFLVLKFGHLIWR